MPKIVCYSHRQLLKFSPDKTNLKPLSGLGNRSMNFQIVHLNKNIIHTMSDFALGQFLDNFYDLKILVLTKIFKDRYSGGIIFVSRNVT
jgi:hypothetical protein